MTLFASILAATDFSADGNNAVRRAALLAHQHGARLTLLHVLKAEGCKPLRDWFSPTTDLDLKGAQALAALRRAAIEISAAYDVTATVDVEVGDPLTVLMQASQRVDLVVLGQRGHGRLETLLVGTTADRMLRTCRRPVLVIKKAVEGPYRQALVPVDFTACSEAALQWGALLACDAHVHVFHALDTHREAVLRRSDVDESVIRDLRAKEAADTGARMRRAAARLGLDAAQLSFSVGRGAADLATLERARALGTDLIVVGRQGRSTLGEFLLGSVSSRVLSGSDCDMLIVPRPREGSPRPSVAPASATATTPAPPSPPARTPAPTRSRARAG